MQESTTYGFGRREGKHLNRLCELLMKFADEQDIALPELLGYLDLAKDAFIEAMIRPGFDSNGEEPQIFPEQEP